LYVANEGCFAFKKALHKQSKKLNFARHETPPTHNNRSRGARGNWEPNVGTQPGQQPKRKTKTL
jgi:hypothetical protein